MFQTWGQYWSINIYIYMYAYISVIINIIYIYTYHIFPVGNCQKISDENPCCLRWSHDHVPQSDQSVGEAPGSSRGRVR